MEGGVCEKQSHVNGCLRFVTNPPTCAAGKVLVNGRPVLKAGTPVSDASTVGITAGERPAAPACSRPPCCCCVCALWPSAKCSCTRLTLHVCMLAAAG